MGRGDDLLQYLIIPNQAAHATYTNPAPKSDPSLASESVVVEDRDREKDYWRYSGQFQASIAESQFKSEDTSEMEFDTTPHPASFGNCDALSLDDYLSARPPPTPKVKQEPPAPKVKATPIAPIPRAVGARSSKHTIELHERYQGLGIQQPEFVFEGGSVDGWWGKVVFRGLLAGHDDVNDDEVKALSNGAEIKENGNVEIHEKSSFSSKQEAKEKLSEGALAVLDELDRMGKVLKRGKTKKIKKDAPLEALNAEKKESEPVINYVGQMLEFQRSTGAPQPTYTDYQLGSGFACLLTIDGYPTTFGTLEAPYFSSKKASRQYAARAAVEHFKAVGQWPDSFTNAGGIKKKKTPAEAPVTSPKIHSPSRAGGDVEGGAASPTPEASKSGSYAQRVAQLATTLSLPTPQYNTSSDSEALGFHTVSCYFKNSAHEGPIGEVRHIFGKKRAREECARLTLEYLQGVKEHRMNYGKRMMDSVIGGDAVANVALGQPLGGHKDFESRVMERQAESQFARETGVDEEESDDEGFESAMED